MSNPRIALLAYCLAVGLILAVAFHPPAKMLTTATAEVPATSQIPK